MENSPLGGGESMWPESETDDILRCPMRPAEEPVNGAKDARLDEGGPLSEACAGGGRERSRERLETWLILFSVCSLIRARLRSGKVDLGGQRTTQEYISLRTNLLSSTLLLNMAMVSSSSLRWFAASSRSFSIRMHFSVT